jgi:hypothetical protein
MFLESATATTLFSKSAIAMIQILAVIVLAERRGGGYLVHQMVKALRKTMRQLQEQ